RSRLPSRSPDASADLRCHRLPSGSKSGVAAGAAVLRCPGAVTFPASAHVHRSRTGTGPPTALEDPEAALEGTAGIRGCSSFGGGSTAEDQRPGWKTPQL